MTIGIDYLKIVDELNDELYEMFEEEPFEEWGTYSYQTDGYYDAISFGDIAIFNSEDNTFYEDYEDETTGEKFKEYLKKEVNKIGQKLIKYSIQK